MHCSEDNFQFHSCLQMHCSEANFQFHSCLQMHCREASFQVHSGLQMHYSEANFQFHSFLQMYCREANLQTNAPDITWYYLKRIKSPMRKEHSLEKVQHAHTRKSDQWRLIAITVCIRLLKQTIWALPSQTREDEQRSNKINLSQ